MIRFVGQGVSHAAISQWGDLIVVLEGVLLFHLSATITLREGEKTTCDNHNYGGVDGGGEGDGIGNKLHTQSPIGKRRSYLATENKR